MSANHDTSHYRCFTASGFILDERRLRLQRAEAKLREMQAQALAERAQMLVVRPTTRRGRGNAERQRIAAWARSWRSYFLQQR